MLNENLNPTVFPYIYYNESDDSDKKSSYYIRNVRGIEWNKYGLQPEAILPMINKAWKEYYIEFKDFKKNAFMSPSLKPKNIRDISIAGYGRDFNVDLAIKDIALF